MASKPNGGTNRPLPGLPTAPDPALKTIWLIRRSLAILPLLALLGGAWLFLSLNGVPDFVFLPMLIPIGLIGVILLLNIVTALVSFRYYSFEVGEEQITIRRGIFTKSETHIPLRKIQDVVVQEGILLRWKGLQSLAIQTAAMPMVAARQGANAALLEGVRGGRGVAEQILQRVRRLQGDV